MDESEGDEADYGGEDDMGDSQNFDPKDLSGLDESIPALDQSPDQM